MTDPTLQEAPRVGGLLDGPSPEAPSPGDGRFGRRQVLMLGVSCCASAVAGGLGVANALDVEVNTYRIPVPRLPRGFSGFTIVQLTDLHHGFGIPIGVVDRVIRRVAHLEKDAIVCTGDYIHGGDGLDAVDAVWSRLATLRAEQGVYSVLGNHDHMNGNEDRSLLWLRRSGQGIRHRAVAVRRAGERIWLGGAGDVAFDEVGVDLAFRDAPPEECKILLAHNPSTADAPFDTRVDLMISGHTHGGQVGIPPFASAMSGFHDRGPMKVFISRGIGWYYLPIRINCPAEIAVLKLVPPDGGPPGMTHRNGVPV